ncbi:MAG: DegT/DnrJ/EryC1/StrS family aminotransferase [Acidobacteriota bacterium]
MARGNIPFFSAAREFECHREEILDAIERTLEVGQVLQGRAVNELEDRIAKSCGRKYGVAVGSCTDALYFALIAAGVRPGDEIFVTDFSFIASASCIARLGAIPVFVDIEQGTYNLNLEIARNKLSSKTRAMVFVHLYGLMSDPVKLEAFCAEHDICLIEDAAQAIGATYNNRPAGSVGFASCFSFDPTKPVSAPGSGGMVLTDDEDAASTVRQLRYHGKRVDGYFHETGYNSQMPTLTAAVLNVKLNHAADWTARRRQIARKYREGLGDLRALRLPNEEGGSKHIYHKYVLEADDRNGLKKHLLDAGIPTMIHYPAPIHRQPCFSGLRCADKDYPVALRSSARVLSIPMHPFLLEYEISDIVRAIRSFFGG